MRKSNNIALLKKCDNIRFHKDIKILGKANNLVERESIMRGKKMKVLKDLKKKKFITKVLNFKSLCGSIRIGQ